MTLIVALVVTLLTPSLVLAAAPDAVGDGYSVDEDDVLVVDTPGVLANDDDPDLDPMTAVMDTGPSDGGLTLDADGGFTYTPSTDFFGSDSFTYHAEANGESSNVVTVSIIVTAVNDPPSATLDTSMATVAEDSGPATLPDRVTAISEGPGNESGQTITFTATPGNASLFSVQPAIGATGTLTFTPAANANGSTSVSVAISDGTTTVPLGSFTIAISAVNDPPLAGSDSYATAEDTPLVVSAPGVLADDTDVDTGTTLQAVKNSDPANGSLTLAANGSFTYTPAADYSGPDSFTYHATDGVLGSNVVTVSITVSAVNDPPSGSLDTTTWTVGEDSGLSTDTGRVSAISKGGPDESGQTITFTATPGNASLFSVQPAIGATGTLTFTPAANANGSTSVSVAISDGTTTVPLGSFTIAISAVNDPPLAGSDSYATAEDTPLVVSAPGVLADDTDVDTGTTLQAVKNSDPANGSLTLAANGSFTYTPAADYSGPDSFTYHATDGVLGSNVVTVSITVSAVNDPPSGSLDTTTWTVGEDSGLSTDTGRVSAISKGGPDESGQTITFTATPGNASLFSVQPAIGATGTLTFTPAANANGSTSVSVAISDGTTTVPLGSFTIAISAVNDPPSGSLDTTTWTVGEDSGLSTDTGRVSAISKGGPDESGQTITFTATPGNASLFSVQPAIGATGTLTFTPAANANGSTSVSVAISDGTTTVPLGSFTIAISAVNDPPLAGSDSYATAEDTPLVVSAPGVLADDTDVDTGTTLQAVKNSDPANGSLTLAANGSFTYTPAADYSGPDSFTYHATDGVLGSNVVTVSITVSAVNDPPSGSLDTTTWTVGEDSGLSTDTGRVSAISKGGPDESGQTITFTATPGNASLFSVQPAIGATGTLTFTPAANANGSTSVSVAISDGTTTVPLGSFTIAISAVNDPPSGSLDTTTWTVGEDSGLSTDTGRVSAISKGGPDESGQTITFTATPGNASLFSVQPAIGATGTLTFTPAANANGSTSVSVAISDGTTTVPLGSFTIAISAVNDPPSGSLDTTTWTVGEDSGLSTDTGRVSAISKGGPDESGQTITFTATPGNASLFSVQPAIGATGTLTFTPAANANGSTSVSVAISDGTTTVPLGSFTIAISAVNDPPSGSLDTTTWTVGEDSGLSTDTGRVSAISKGGPDESGQTITFTATPGNASLFSVQPAIGATGTLTFTPAANANGSTSVSVAISDGTTTVPLGSFTIAISAVNDPPTGSLDTTTWTVGEDSGLSTDTGRVSAISKGGPDESGQTITFTATPGNASLFSVQPAIGATGTLTFTPAANANGSTSVSVAISDGTTTVPLGSFTIAISAVNDPPSGSLDTTTWTVGEDSGLSTDTGRVSAISKGGPDESGQTITFTATPGNASLFSVQPAIGATGTLTFTPAANANGSTSVSVAISDGTTTVPLGSFTIAISAVNDPPLAGSDSYATAEDTPLVVSAPGVLADDTDVDTGTTLQAVKNSDPANGSLTLAANGSFTYTPAADYSGPDSFTYHATDGVLGSNVVTVSITVSAVNDPPSFTLLAPPSVVEDSGVATVAGFLTAIDPGPADESSQTVIIGAPLDVASPLLFSQQPAIGATGTLTFKPATNRSGTSLVTVTATDDGGVANGGDDTGSQTFLITVAGTNDPPTANSDYFTSDPDDDGPPVEAGMLTPLDVLANDFTLPDVGETMTIVAASKPGHGTIVIAAGGGGLSYRSTTGYAGSDTFGYTISDGSYMRSATVHLTVADTLPPSLAPPTFRFDTGAQLTSTVRVIMGWSASDPGSGVKSYDVQQSTNGGSTWTSLLSATSGTSSTRSLGLTTTYTYRFRARDKGNRLSAWSAPVTFAPTRYQDSTSLATYSSSWKSATITSASGDHTKYAKGSGALSTFSFTGRAVSLVAPRSSSRGKADIRVDGVLVATVSLYRSSTDARHHVWSRSWSAVGPHVVTVTVRGTSGHPRFDVDAWTVLK